MKKIITILLASIFFSVNMLGVFAATEPDTTGYDLFSEDFQNFGAGGYSGTVTVDGASVTRRFEPTDHISVDGKNSNIKIEERNGNKYLQVAAYTNKLSQMGSSIKVDPQIPENVTKYTIRFDMKYTPYNGAGNKYLYLHAGNLWKMTGSTSGTGVASSTYALYTDRQGSGTIEGPTGGFSTNQFYTYQITVEKKKNEERDVTLSVGAKGSALNVIYKNVPKRTYSKSTSVDVLLLYYHTSMVADLCIDNIQVLVDDVADTTYAANADWRREKEINFENFTAGKLPLDGTNVGGFSGLPEATIANASRVYIGNGNINRPDYTDTTTSNRYLKIEKNATGGTLPIKREISDAVAGYSKFEVSLDINNRLTTGKCTIRVGDGGTGYGTGVQFNECNASGAISFYTNQKNDGTIQSVSFAENHKITNSAWTNIRFVVYRDICKYDLYVDGERVGADIGSRHAHGGDVITIVPETDAIGSVLIDNIKVITNEADKSDYALTYDAGSADTSCYGVPAITATCKVQNADITTAPIVILANMDASGTIKKIAISGEMNGEKEITATLTEVDRTAGDSVRIMLVHDFATFRPLKRMITLTPSAVQ